MENKTLPLHPDRRVQKTRQAIRDAFFSLLWESSGGRITVAQIARTANIDRKTFYLHYDSVEEIFEDFSHEKLEDLRKLLEENGFFLEPFRPDAILTSMNQLLMENLPFYRKLSQRLDVFDFWTQVQTMLSDTIVSVYQDMSKVPRRQLELHANYFAAGILTIYVRWLQNDNGMSLEELGQCAGEIAAFGLLRIFAPEDALPLRQLAQSYFDSHPENP